MTIKRGPEWTKNKGETNPTGTRTNHLNIANYMLIIYSTSTPKPAEQSSAFK